MTSPSRALLALALALSASACAGPRAGGPGSPPARPGGPCEPAEVPCSAPDVPSGARSPAGASPDIAFPPEEVKVGPVDLELSGKNDEELFAIGTAAYGAGEYARAAAAFARLADLFPGSRHDAAALYDAGLAYQRLGEWRLALERFRAMTRRYEGPDADEAAFRVAECRYHLGELAEARAALDAIQARPGIDAPDRVRALAQRGVVELEDGRAEDAERTLRLALGVWAGASEDARLDPYHAAQAQFYLGEVYRTWFEALPLDPSSGDEARLRADLEAKAEMLLSAQGHYLRAIRLGDDDWSVAAGFKIGGLYDALRSAMVDAPLPPGLSGEEVAAYRGLLRERVRVLATKAVAAWEATVARASRSGREDNRYLGEAEGALERLRRVLADEAAGAADGGR